MWSRRRLATSLLLGLLALTVLFGCRAFEPAVVIVNKPPETYLIGAPAESSGGYYHFHVWWYGTDEDGQVTKYVWALTDSSLQDHTSVGDEEDQRFNPATNASTLQIGHWTTRTDTIFDFTIRRGANLALAMTLHMVAVDDRGDFDRTPARLYFLSNAVDVPKIHFYADLSPHTHPFADYDTIGYGKPFVLAWDGSTGNIRSYSPELLAARDTVGAKDGLFGFKFRLPEVSCDAAREDCWQPRHTVDSVSYFSEIDHLRFTDDNSGPDIRNKRLGDGVHQLLVNTVDVAGVQVPANKQILHFVINYDPDTKIVRGQDQVFTNDTHTYPYYIIFRPDPGGGPSVPEEHAFAEGDTVPDKCYVVFKALGWDDPRDTRLGTSDFDVQFQAAFEDTGLFGGTSKFPFATQFSAPHYTSDNGDLTHPWQRREVTGPHGNPITVSADTVGFPVGPFKYKVVMRAVDEQGRRDGTPETFTFYGNRKPCVQGVEVLVGAETVSPDADILCKDPVWKDKVDTVYASLTPPALGDTRRYADQLGAGLLWYSPNSDAVWIDPPPSTAEPDSMPGYFFEYRLALHGRDDPRETWDPNRPQDRIPSWNYRIWSQSDSTNIVAEGGGIDNVQFTTYSNEVTDPTARIFIDDEGVWILRIKIFIPQYLMFAGGEAYLQYLNQTAHYPDYQKRFHLTTLQLGESYLQVIANDAATCVVNPDHSAYHFWKQLRIIDPPDGYPSGDLHPRWACLPTFPDEAGKIRLSDFAFSSSNPKNVQRDPPYKKTFVIKVLCGDGSIFP